MASELPCASVETIRGPAAGDAVPGLLIEVPHGADRAAHYFALRERLVGDIPDGLEAFFFVNTDVGAWQLGRRLAERWVAADPARAATVVRCLLPRTFIDCNRLADLPGGDLTKGGMTAGIPAYVRDARDQALLLALHADYVATIAPLYARIVGGGGLAVVPHTFAPRTVGIERVDDAIVPNLRAAWAPGTAETWPLRPEVDLITRDAAGVLMAPEGAEESLVERFAAVGITAVPNATYVQHPATLGYRWASEYPGKVLAFEVRRDLLVDKWTPFAEMAVSASKLDRFADALLGWID
jgi:hypothetical protein